MSERIVNDPSQHGWVLENGKWVWGASGSGDSIGGVLISVTEPVDKTEGMMWMDTSTAPAKIWIWDADKWIEMPFSGGGAPAVAREITGLEYLVIGGGGAGGTGDGYRGGGGGAGGYRTNVPGDTSGGNSPAEDPYPTIPIGTQLSVVVGEGGYATDKFLVSSATHSDFDGGNVIKQIRSLRGGRGGNNGTQGQDGGSAGGAFAYYGCPTTQGTAGQGFEGGGENKGNYGAAGGGGAGSQGTNGGLSTEVNAGGNGGSALTSSIDGLNKARAGGGGGGGTTGGGIGPGGAGDGSTTVGNTDPQHWGDPNTGSGGGGANSWAGSGGSGVVIVRYPGDQAANGGDITAYNGYTVHTFNNSGTFEVWS